MLTQLSIRNIVLIDRLDLALEKGLLVLTGETGAGKSILLDSLGLGLGARSDAGLVRQGAEQASVSLTFTLPKKHAARDVLDALGLAPAADEPLILRRVLGRDGRSRAFVNDEPIAINALRRIGERLVEVHGQFETHGLLDRETHLGFLDRFAGLEADAVAIAALYRAWKESCALYESAAALAHDAKRRAEDIRLSCEELTRLAPLPGEAEALAEKRQRLQAREKIMEALQAAHNELQEESGAAKRMGSARRMLTRAAEKAPELLTPALDALARAEDALFEGIGALENILRSDDFDATVLEKSEERLFALRAAARKYQCTPDDLPTLLGKLQDESRLLQDDAGALEKLAKDRMQKEAAYFSAAHALHAVRGAKAQDLEKAVTAELPPLKLGSANFVVQLEKLPDHAATAEGISRVTFLASINPGMPPSPLHKSASGGELARFMLALRLCLAEDSSIATLVFDEVDTGIGGATADAVGERLARLARTVQTLVVTHSPQVAARGSQHARVEKESRKGTTTTQVRLLNHEERLEEIARMLAGNIITDAARAAAGTLLSASATPAKGRKKA